MTFVYAEGRTASVREALTTSFVRGRDRSAMRGIVASEHAIESDASITKHDRFMVPSGGHEFMMKTVSEVGGQLITRRSSVTTIAAL
jgi:hypothetical protein